MCFYKQYYSEYPLTKSLIMSMIIFLWPVLRNRILGSKDIQICKTINFFFQRLFIFGTERDRAWTGEGQRERERDRIRNRLQALSHQPRAWRGALTHGPRDRDLAEVGCLTDCATQAPQICKTFNTHSQIMKHENNNGPIYSKIFLSLWTPPGLNKSELKLISNYNQSWV